MTDYRYRLTLTLKAPVLSQAAGALGFGYDYAMLRDGETPALPGSLVRGNLRDALRRFVPLSSQPELAPNIVDWFGPEPPAGATENQPSEQDRDAEPEDARARLHFDYAWRCVAACPPKPKPVLPRYRITVDADSGTVEDGALVAIEATHPAGEELKFEGVISARFDTGEDAENDKAAENARFWLEKAARFLPAVGALKGVGFGRVLGASLTKIEPVEGVEPPAADASPTVSGDRIGIVLRLDRPFCIAEPHPGDSNVYESQETIPGGVLKGALAARLTPAEIAGLDFDRLVFTHALPARLTDQESASPEFSGLDFTQPPAAGVGDASRRGRVAPLSLAWVGPATTTQDDGSKAPIEDNLLDLALPPADLPQDQAFAYLVRWIDGKPEAPKFQIDWKPKEWEAARQLLGFYECSHTLEIHTEIQAGTGQSAESRLFSRDCIDPAGLVFCADIDLSAVDPKQQGDVLQKLLAQLARPLTGIGKTKAAAEVFVQPRPFLAAAPPDPVEGNLYLVTLQTPALLFTAEAVQKVPASGGGEALRQVYAAYWQAISDSALSLAGYHAAQQLRGGWYLWKSGLAQHHPQDKTYRPFWLTNAGSVFVLKAEDKDNAGNLLDDWRRRGLPPPPDFAADASHAQWRYNPYIPENGYGEIRVNDAVHLDRRPPRPQDWNPPEQGENQP
jgi:hypothetical protein